MGANIKSQLHLLTPLLSAQVVEISADNVNSRLAQDDKLFAYLEEAGVHFTYPTTAALIADQSNQLEGLLYLTYEDEALASNNTLWRYDGTTAGDISDYDKIAGGGGGVAAGRLVVTDAANVTIDATNYNVLDWTLGGNRTLDDITGMTDGEERILILRQDATGTRTITWPTTYRFPAAEEPELSTSGTDIFKIVRVDTEYWVNWGQQDHGPA